MKNVYVAPKITLVKILPANMLVMSAVPFDDGKNASQKRDFCVETQCPFNNEWCIDKQKRFDAWHEAADYFAKNNVDKLFFVSQNTFNGCPNCYNVLCAQHKQKQRG